MEGLRLICSTIAFGSMCYFSYEGALLALASPEKTTADYLMLTLVSLILGTIIHKAKVAKKDEPTING